MTWPVVVPVEPVDVPVDVALPEEAVPELVASPLEVPPDEEPLPEVDSMKDPACCRFSGLYRELAEVMLSSGHKISLRPLTYRS
jgi:hypothetical protein